MFLIITCYIVSLQEGEISADMYSFHEAISHVQEMEEEVLDSHKAVIEVSSLKI